MKIVFLKIPAVADKQDFIRLQATLGLTYAPLHGTQAVAPVPGHDNDHIRVLLSENPADFNLACQAIRNWQMFPRSWTQLYPAQAPLQEGTELSLYARFARLWWRNACRIVYTIDEPGRFGFAYGTLPGHMEMGEELFLVEKDATGRVWYQLKAFSRPRHWLARMAYPIMRLLQARFRRESAAQMQKFVRNANAS